MISQIIDWLKYFQTSSVISLGCLESQMDRLCTAWDQFKSKNLKPQPTAYEYFEKLSDNILTPVWLWDGKEANVVPIE